MPRRPQLARGSKQVKAVKEQEGRRQYQAWKAPTTIRMDEGSSYGVVEAEGNLILVDSETGQPFLQRLSPTSYKKKQKAARSAAEGLKKMEIAMQGANPGTKRSKLDLGIWHGIGNSTFNVSHDLRTGKGCPQLLGWARDHCHHFLLPLKSLL